MRGGSEKSYRNLKIFFNFLQIGITSFGAATTENIRQQMVERQALLSAGEFRDNITLAGFIPGPFHVNLACITGYRIAGPLGSLWAIVGYIFPGFVIVLLLAQFLALRQVHSFLENSPGLITGMIAGVCGLLLQAILDLGQRTIEERADWLLVVFAAVILYFFRIHFILIAVPLGFFFFLRASIRRKKSVQ